MDAAEGDRRSINNPEDQRVTGGVAVLPWRSRVSSMPYFSGGSQDQISALKLILNTVRRGVVDPDTHIAMPDGQQHPLGEVLKTLHSTGFLSSTSGDIHLTTEAETWIDTEDDGILVQILHSRVRFVGELLHAIASGAQTTRDLNNIARNTYDLEWTTLDQVRRRLSWLVLTHCVKYRTQKDLYITDEGRCVLDALELGVPEPHATPPEAPDAFLPPPPEISSLLARLTPEVLDKRNPVIGYIPGGDGSAGPSHSLEMIVNASTPSVSKNDFISFVTDSFSISTSSYGALQTTLTKAGLVEQTAINTLEATAAAKSWLESGDPRDLVYIFHAHHLLVLEIVQMLEYANKVPEIKRAASDRYGIPNISSNSIRHRLRLLQAAGFITPLANNRFAATPLGLQAANAVPTSKPSSTGDSGRLTNSPEEIPISPSVHLPDEATSIAQTLRASGTKSEHSLLLEKSVESAFRFLGFETTHIGGSGDTDVVANYWSNTGVQNVVIVDAKAARSGNVSEGSVSFDTLREHRKKNHANSVVLVGPGFEGKRLRERAQQNDVRLLTTDTLAKIVLRHATVPLSANRYESIGESEDSIGATINGHHDSHTVKLALLREVVALLASEREQADRYTNGALTAREIHLMSRNRAGSKSSPDDIDAILDLLRNPLIDAVHVAEAGKDRPATFFLTDSPETISAKLSSLAKFLIRPYGGSGES